MLDCCEDGLRNEKDYGTIVQPYFHFAGGVKVLAELSIKNFAIIDSVSISFEDGFTVLTGETGAGKSIIIDAIQLLVGGRGSSDFVRHGTKRAEIEGLFLIDDNPRALKKAREFGIEVEEGMLILHRDIYATGK